MADPDKLPKVSRPSMFRPEVEVQGNREVLPGLTQYLRLYLLPSNPINAFMKLCQYYLSSALVSWLIPALPSYILISLSVVSAVWLVFACTTMAKHEQSRYDITVTLLVILLGLGTFA